MLFTWLGIAIVSGYENHYMQQKCGELYNLSFLEKRYGFIKLTSSTQYSTPSTCEFTVRAKAYEKLFVSVRWLDLRSCDKDTLTVKDDSDTLGNPLCGLLSTENTSYVIHNGLLNLEFSAAEGAVSNRGFELSYTSFREAETCEQTEFQCNTSRRCIPYELRNDKVKNCEDNSDEVITSTSNPGSASSSHTDSTVAIVVGVVLGVVGAAILAVVIGVASYFCCCRGKNSNSFSSTAQYPHNVQYSASPVAVTMPTTDDANVQVSAPPSYNEAVSPARV